MSSPEEDSWLDVSGAVGQRIARRLGVVATFWLMIIAVHYLISERPASIAGLFTVGRGIELLFAILGACCALVLWRRSSVVASTLVLVMVVMETAARLVSSDARDFTIPIMALLFTIQAVRGSIASRSI